MNDAIYYARRDIIDPKLRQELDYLNNELDELSKNYRNVGDEIIKLYTSSSNFLHCLI